MAQLEYTPFAFSFGYLYAVDGVKIDKEAHSQTFHFARFASDQINFADYGTVIDRILFHPIFMPADYTIRHNTHLKRYRNRIELFYRLDYEKAIILKGKDFFFLVVEGFCEALRQLRTVRGF